jgi:phosphatidylserine synthase
MGRPLVTATLGALSLAGFVCCVTGIVYAFKRNWDRVITFALLAFLFDTLGEMAAHFGGTS